MKQPSPDACIDEAVISLLKMLYAGHYRFITVTPATHQRVHQRAGRRWSHTLQDFLGWNLPWRTETMEPALLDLMQSAQLLRPVEDGWQSLVRISSLDDMLFMHSAYPTDANDAVFFGPDTYRFARALRLQLPSHTKPVQRAVDIGTGAGAGALLLAQHFPQAEIWGLDINDTALKYAATNGRAAGIDNVRFRHSDLLSGCEGDFDLIIANPPYLVDPKERAYRHGSGPLGAQLSLDIVEAALRRLTPGGALMLYTGVAMVNGADPFLAAVQALIAHSGYSLSYAEIDPDIFSEELASGPYAHADRIAAVWLVLQRPGPA